MSLIIRPNEQPRGTGEFNFGAYFTILGSGVIVVTSKLVIWTLVWKVKNFILAADSFKFTKN